MIIRKSGPPKGYVSYANTYLNIASPLTRGILAAYHFDRAGVVFRDLGPYGLNAKFNNSLGYFPDTDAVAVGPFGDNSYIDVYQGFTRYPTGNQERTFTLLYKFTTSTPTTQALAGWGDNSPPDGCRWYIFWAAPNAFLIEGRNASASFTYTPDTEWHTITGVLPKGGTTFGDIILYHDGVLQSMSYSNPSTAVATNTSGVVFGREAGFFGFGAIETLLKGAWVWDRALSPTEIMEHARDPLAMFRHTNVYIPLGYFIPDSVNGSGESIPSAEAFDTGSLDWHIIGDASIDSAEAFEVDGYTFVGVTGSNLDSIPTAEAFGTPGVLAIELTDGVSIESAEAFGTPGYAAVPVYGDVSIPSSEAFGAGGALEARVIGLPAQSIASLEAFGVDGLVTTGAPTQVGLATWQLWISGVNCIDYLRADTLKVDLQANFQGSASFDLFRRAGSYMPEVGSSILIMWYDTRTAKWERVFAGTIEEVEYSKQAPLTRQEFFIGVRCTDYARTLSRRVITRNYTQVQFGSVNSIMADIAEQYLKPEGLTFLPLATDVPLGDKSFLQRPLQEALQEIADQIGMTFLVDFYRNLSFVDPTIAPSSPFNITEDMIVNWRDLNVTRSRGLYRNRQIIKASYSQTSSLSVLTYILPLSKTIPPYDHVEFWDGQFFTDSRYTSGVARIVEIKLDGVPIPWFTLGQPSVADWQYMQVDANALDLIWNLLGTPSGYPTTPGTELELTVEFQNEAPGPIVVEDAVEIAARQAIEGGSGVYEAVEEVVDPSSPEALTDYGYALLARFKKMAYDVSFQTRWYGLLPNQSVNINLPSHSVDNVDMVVNSISLSERARTDLLVNVVASSNSTARNALAAMQRLVSRTRKSPSRQEKSITFILAETIPGVDNPGIVVGNNMTVAYIVRRDITLKDIAIYAKTAPTGQDAIFRINRNGSSIMTPGYTMNYTAGATGIERHSNFNGGVLTLAKDSIITIDITQIGSVIPGSDFTIVVTGYV